MKYFSTLLLFLFLSQHRQLHAQSVSIPDTSFRNYLQSTYPSCIIGNQLDTTCTEVLQEWFMEITNLNIYSLLGLQYFKNLQYLKCDFNHLTSLPRLPAGLTELNCNYNSITSLPAIPSSLTVLKVSGNHLHTLPALPTGMFTLNCDNNELVSMTNLPATLITFSCQNNLLASLPALPPLITEYDFSFNKLVSLPALPDTVTQLVCMNNELISLPAFPHSIRYVDAINNKISSLPEFPSSLKFLFISNNRITSLPPLNSLVDLAVDDNKLTSLPEIPATMDFLNCERNQLTSVPALPNTLTQLYLSENQLTQLPPLPDSLNYLTCEHNHLSELPAIPLWHGDHLYGMQIYCDYNPLNCLPPLPSGTQLSDVQHTNITCIPNPLIYFQSLPVCSDPSGICGTYAFAKGKIYIDRNNNGSYDPQDTLLSQQFVKVSPGNWITASDLNGNYLVKTDTAIVNTWSYQTNWQYTSVFPSSYTLTPLTLGVDTGQYDFGIHLEQNVKDLEAVLAGSPARPGFTMNVTLRGNNRGTVLQNNIIAKLKKPSGFTVVSSTTTPSYIIGDTLFWTNVSIDYFQNKNVTVQFLVPPGTPAGSDAIYEAWINGTSGDTTPQDNYTKWTEEVRSSFDPNDKLVNKDILFSGYNAESERLIYTIRFQNTGTDTAFSVIVRDIIPSNLDISSVRVVNTSHPYQLIIREKNIIEVAFPNILLPDSATNEIKSHGFVQLSFKPTEALPANTEIDNSASILFDYNVPVSTNTAQTKILIATGIAQSQKWTYHIFPNPATEKITVALPFAANGKWIMADLNGRIIKENSVPDNLLFEINIADVPAGAYILSLELNGILSTSKIVIIR